MTCARRGAPWGAGAPLPSLDVIRAPRRRACIILREISICGAVYSLYLRVFKLFIHLFIEISLCDFMMSLPQTTVASLFTNPAAGDECLLPGCCFPEVIPGSVWPKHVSLALGWTTAFIVGYCCICYLVPMVTLLEGGCVLPLRFVVLSTR